MRVKITPVQKETNADYPTSSAIDALKAKDIIFNMGKVDYGIRFEEYYPELSTRTYFTQVVITDPNGYTQIVVYRDEEYGKGYDAYYMLGDELFPYIYDATAEISKGTWKVDFYWDGMLVNQSTFEVQ